MKSWLRLNWLPLTLVAVLLPLTLAVTLWNEWRGYLEFGASQAIEVDATDTVEYAGTEWTVVQVSRFGAETEAGKAAGLPEATELVRAIIAATPLVLDEDGRSPHCSMRLLELDGAGRSWDDAFLAPLDYRIDDEHEFGCTSAVTEPYRIEVFFAVPEGTSESLAITLEVNEQLPRYLQLQLEL